MPAVSLSVGTDCSGMEAPVQALKALGISVNHKFSCDIDKAARSTIAANFPPETMYEDITKRDVSKVKAVDLYVAGFPCQPFSAAGRQEGFTDSKGRGKIFFDVRQYIAKKRPKVFILENVQGLVRINKGTYFKAILKSLDAIGEYNVYHKIMNTKEHGVPHSRPRVYMVGIRKDVDDMSFEFPKAIPAPSMEMFLDKRPRIVRGKLPVPTATTAVKNVKSSLKELEAYGEDPLHKPYVIDCDSTVARSKYMLGVSPCITCGRAQGHWVTSRGRRLNKPEMMRLQGMNPKGFKVAVTVGQLGKQLGNTMSVNVLERVLVSALPAAKLAPKGSLEDRWASGSAVKALAATRGCELTMARAAPKAQSVQDDGAAAADASKGKAQRAAPEAARPAAKRRRIAMI